MYSVDLKNEFFHCSFETRKELKILPELSNTPKVKCMTGLVVSGRE